MEAGVKRMDAGIGIEPRNAPTAKYATVRDRIDGPIDSIRSNGFRFV